MPSSNPVLAILVADLHLSHNPPAARAGEPCWYEAMRRPLAELARLKSDHGGAPILCAGDVFDRWNPPPELINFALEHLPSMYAVPGQHDLPCHNYEDIHKSAYWTMVRTNRIVNVRPGHPFPLESGLVVHGFPWGRPPAPVKRNPRWTQVALVHEYTWVEGAGYPGAPGKFDEARYEGFGAAAIGDNHVPWAEGVAWNCGGFMRRNADQSGLRPRAGLLRADGRVEPYYLDTAGEVLTVAPPSDAEAGADGVERFIRHIQDLQGAHVDYREALERACRAARPEVAAVIREALG